MKTRIPSLIAVACGGLLLLAPAAPAQERVDRPRATDRAQQDGRSERELVSLLERLEMGMSALGELGRGAEAELVGRVAEQVRRQLERRHAAGADRPEGIPGDADGEVERAVRRDLRVMRLAVEAFAEAEQPDRAHRVEMAMHARELMLSGRRDEEARRIIGEAPQRQELAGLLHDAGKLHRERGRAEAAERLMQLSTAYAGEQGQRREVLDLSERAQRLRILRWARDAHREAGHGDAVELANRFIHVGEVQESGAGPEDVAAAAEGLRMESAVRILRAGAELWDGKGWEGRARACRALADFYAERLQPQAATDAPPAAQDRAAELRARMAELQAEMEALRAELQRMQDRPLRDRR